MIKFDVLVESPTIKTSDLFVYDDSKAQDKGAIVMKVRSFTHVSIFAPIAFLRKFVL